MAEAITGTARATLEQWLGPIEFGQQVGQLEDLQARMERLSLPQLVALEVLNAQMAQMILSAGQFSSDDVRTNHEKNVQWLEAWTAKLVASIRADDDISLTPEQEKLVAAAETPDDDAARVIEVEVPNRRRG